MNQVLRRPRFWDVSLCRGPAHGSGHAIGVVHGKKSTLERIGRREISSAASKPLMAGMVTSMMIMSGVSCCAMRTASCPLAASPQISHSGSASSTRRIPRRTISWSSAINILTILTAKQPSPQKQGTGITRACDLKAAAACSADDATSRFRDQVAYRISHNFGHGMAIEFSHQIDPMRFRRLYTDAQDGGDFLAALTLGEELYDFALAGS